MKIKNLKEWWESIVGWKRKSICLVAILTLISFVILISGLQKSFLINAVKVPVFMTLSVFIILILLALFFWLDTKNPKYYWKGGFMVTVTYFIFFVLIALAGTSGREISLAAMFIFFPFGFFYSSLLPGNPLLTYPFNDLRYFSILIFLNFITIILIGILIGYIACKIKKNGR